MPYRWSLSVMIGMVLFSSAVSMAAAQTVDTNQGSAVAAPILPGANPSPATITKYIPPPPPPTSCLSGSCLNNRNVKRCTSQQECTASTQSCQVCYTQLFDTQPKVGLVHYGDTQLYRFSLCDGQTPFRVSVTSVFGNADLHIWNQPDLSKPPNMTSTQQLAVTVSVDLAANKGIRTYTFGVVGAGLFGTSYRIWVETQVVQLSRGITLAHSVNEGCSQYYSWLNEYPKNWTESTQYGGSGHAFPGSVPDQILTSVETRGSYFDAGAKFNIYTYFNTLKRPEILALTPNNTRGLVGTALPGRSIGYNVNGQRRVYGYPTKNEYTMLSPQYGKDTVRDASESASWKWGRYYTSVKLVEVSLCPPSPFMCYSAVECHTCDSNMF